MADRVPIDGGVPQDVAGVVYDELRRVARRHLRRPPGRVARTTSMVHEVWLRMQGRWAPASGPDAGFATFAASVLRSILVDEARHRLRLKRGGGWSRVRLEGAARLPAPRSPLEAILDLDESLRALERWSARRAQVVELRHFGGLSVAETARVLGIAERTVEQDWRLARAWLRARLDGGAHTRPPARSEVPA